MLFRVLRAARREEGTGEGETRKRAEAGREVAERRGSGSARASRDWVERSRKDGRWRAEAEGRGGRGRKKGTSGEQGTFGGDGSFRERSLTSPVVEGACKSMELVGSGEREA